MKEEKFGVGTKHLTKEGHEIEIVGKISGDKRRLRFKNGHEVETGCSNIRKGMIKNPYHLSVFGVGCLGLGYYKGSVNRKHTPEYIAWKHMLERCYDEKCQEKNPTYKGTMVCSEWHNFQNFAKWYHENYPKIKGVKFDLDKDLLQENVEDKLYSPETCTFLPHNVNAFLANKNPRNTSGYTGVSWHKPNKKWMANMNLFGEEKKKTLGRFDTPELASQSYQKARAEQSEKVKDYLRSLNYLPEETIQLVK